MNGFEKNCVIKYPLKSTGRDALRKAMFMCYYCVYTRAPSYNMLPHVFCGVIMRHYCVVWFCSLEVQFLLVNANILFISWMHIPCTLNANVPTHTPSISSTILWFI